MKCSLYFTDKYIEPILNGTDPVLEDPLIPVTIEDDGTVKKADLSSEWYDYETKQWANTVILFDESKTYASGDIIPEENIESYFVWIPKYRYQLWDLGLYDSLTEIEPSKVHEIPIIFGDYNTNDSVSRECTTPMGSGASGNCEVGDYMTHPAFISIPSTGFWVGKFETGYEGAANPTEAEQNIRDANKIIVKPNVYSWRRIQIANAFYTSYDYNRDLDSHMMKNTEWGAVAYLSHSAYGSATKVRINNNLDYITGYQANNEPTCGWTNTNEALMGLEVTENGIYTGYDEMYNSGFNGLYTRNGNLKNDGMNMPSNKYYDAYNYNGDSEYGAFYNRILGDATGELGAFEILENMRQISSWYSSDGHFVGKNSPWFANGSEYRYGKEANIMVFGAYRGDAGYNITFRVILTP